MMNITVLASGSGTNLQAIIDSIEKKTLDAKIQCVVSDRKSAYALERAKSYGINACWINTKDYSSREEHEKVIIEKLNETKVEYVVLAGYMRLLTPVFIRAFPNRIINIHPALLPSFPGAHGIEDAFKSGVKVTGVTVHFVDEGVDTGPIIAQVPVEINELDTLESLEKKIHTIEHQLYPQVLQWISKGRVSVMGRKVIIQ